MNEGRIEILLVEDDEDDYVLTRALLDEVQGVAFDIHWARNVASALEAVRRNPFDAVLLDYRLGEETGLDFLGRMPLDVRLPVVVLTGERERSTDVMAMQAGAADFLVKSELSAGLLERSLRYAIERERMAEVLRLRTRAVEAIGEGVVITDAASEDNAIIYVNPAFAAITGYAEEEVIGRNCRFLQGEGTDPRAIAKLRRALAAGEAATVELLNYRRDGTSFWNCLSISPVHDPGGKLTHFVGVQQDATVRRSAEADRDALLRALAAERSRLASIIEEAPAIMAVVRGPEHVFEVANAAYMRLVGDRELLGRRVADALPEIVEQGFIELLDGVFTTGNPFNVTEMPILLRRKPDAPLEERILSFVYQPLREASGKVFGILAHGVDVTDAVRSQERLRAAEAHYRRLVTNAPETVYALDRDARFIELNPAGEAMLQREAASVLGTRMLDLVAEPDRPACGALVAGALAGSGEHGGTEIHIVRPSGEERLVRVAIAPIVEGDEVTGVHGTAYDITEERSREAQMRLLAAALESLEQGVAIVDEEGRYLYANAAHARLLGYDPGAHGQFGPEDFVPDEEGGSEMRAALEAVLRDGSWSGRGRRRRRSDGREITVDITTGRVIDQGRILLFTLIQDADDRIAREQHLRRVERLASIGTTLGGVAHELNNPLTAVLNFTELLLLTPRPTEEREDLEMIRRETQRMAKIVADLRLIARQSQEDSHRQAVDLNGVVLHVLRVRGYSLKTSNIEVRTELAEGLAPVWADGGELEQVVLNLVVNAEQSMVAHRGAGVLIVRTRATQGGTSLHVVDDGLGIPRAHLDRLFDPFFTTKPPQEGTGLGLPLVHSIVLDHGGSVLVDSVEGAGASFRIELPAASQDHPSGGGTIGGREHLRAAEPRRVLVVDDEAAIRRALVRFLTRRGHHVDEAADGAEALVAVADGEYDVILSDVRMPGLGGRRLLERLRELGGGMEERLVFMTGEVGPEVLEILGTSSAPLLEKPFDLFEVARVVEQRAAGAG